jgi:hypothetical protein
VPGSIPDDLGSSRMQVQLPGQAILVHFLPLPVGHWEGFAGFTYLVPRRLWSKNRLGLIGRVQSTI